MSQQAKIWVCRYKTTRKGSIKDNIVREFAYLATSDAEAEVLVKEVFGKADRIQDTAIENFTLKLYSFGKILDIGCGVRKFGHIGIDRELKKGVDIVADARFLPFQDHSFDTLIMNHVLEHITDYDTALKEMQRVSKSLIIIVVPRKEHSYVNNEHVHHLDREEWLNILRQGFDVEESFEIGISYIFVCCKWVRKDDKRMTTNVVEESSHS